MELTSPQLNVLKINSKKGYVLVDPDTSEDAKIVILNDGSEKELVQTEENLIIYGPGDFETAGILIKGARNDSETVYTVDTGEGRVLVAQSSSIAKLADEDEFDAVVIKAVGSVDEAVLASLSSKLIVVYGTEANIPDSIKANKVAKINLKKKEELPSIIVYLEKK